MTTRMRCDKPESAKQGVNLQHFLEVIDNKGARADADLAVWMPLLGDELNVGNFDSGFWVFTNLQGDIKLLMREETPDVGMSDVEATADTFFWAGNLETLRTSLTRVAGRMEMNNVGDGSAQHLLSIFLTADSGTIESQTRNAEEALQRYGLRF